MILLIDNYDSFSYNLYQLVGSLSPDIQVVRNDQVTVADIREKAPSHLIVSPGPGRPADARVCEAAVRELSEELPILGVCLGHQAICEAFGGVVSYAKELMHGKPSQVALDRSCPLFRGLPANHPGGPVSLPGGGGGHPAGVPDRHRPNRRRGGDGGAI